MNAFQRECEYPRQMLDSNLAMDRAKIAYIAQLPNGGQLILDALNEERPMSIQRLADLFGVEDMLAAVKDEAFMASLLYYFGVLTFGGRGALGKLVLRIPNLVVRQMYVERIRELLLPDLSQDELLRTAETFYTSGDLQPVCDFVEQGYFKIFANRDYRWANELTVKTAFLTLLFNDLFYVMDSEPALDRDYADLVMIVRPDMRQYALLDILIEFKYISLQEVGMSGAEVREMSANTLKELTPVQRKLTESRAKLLDYRRVLQEVYGDALRLRAYSVVSVGFDRLAWAEAA